MTDADGDVIAVLDWEICALGDPLADLGLLMVYWNEATDTHPTLGAPTATEGFFTRQQMLDRYAEVSGRDLSLIDYYTAFGYWKLACIVEGVYARYIGGAMGGSADTSAYDIVRQAGRALRAAGRRRRRRGWADHGLTPLRDGRAARARQPRAASWC